MAFLQIDETEIDENVTGFLISITDLDELAKAIAIIAMGQADHAARIVADLEPNEPAITLEELCDFAERQLSINGQTDDQKQTSQHHRDGFLFECISWASAHMSSQDHLIIKAPHIKATTQGLDGLVLHMDPEGPSVSRATILEDKCTNYPRRRFRNEVLKGFKAYHGGERSPELVSAASDLLKQAQLNGTEATKAAARVLDNKYRGYRAALTTPDTINTPEKRSKLFKGYKDLEGLHPEQREGFMLLVPSGELREWFGNLADLTILAVKEFRTKHV